MYGQELIQAAPWDGKETDGDFLTVQTIQTGTQATGFQMILTAGAIQKRQLMTETFYKDMTALFLQGGTCVSEHSTTKAVNTFVEIGTTGIKIVVPERTATEKNKTQRQQQILSRTYPKAGNRGPYNGGHRQK